MTNLEIQALTRLGNRTSRGPIGVVAHLPKHFFCLIDDLMHDVRGWLDVINIGAGLAAPERGVFKVAAVVGRRHCGVVARYLQGGWRCVD